MKDISTEIRLRKFWVKFIEEFKKDLNIKDKILIDNKKQTEEEINNLKVIIIDLLKELKNKLLNIKEEELTIEEYKNVKKITKIMFFIIKNHPFMSSKYEDIIKIQKGNYQKIKSEALIGNNLLEDKIIKENFISNRNELIEMITKHKLLKNIGIELTLKHIETAIYINKDMKRIKEKLSINISEEEINDYKFYLKLKEIKEKLKNKLNIEISEIIQFELLEYEINFHKKEVWENLKRLKSLGIDLSIDDFGSNFSNLKRIKEIRKNQQEKLEYIKTIKIDKKITSTVAFYKFKQHIKDKNFHPSSNEVNHFITHLSNIIEIERGEIKKIFENESSQKIEEILLEINKKYNINIEKQVKKEYKIYQELIKYLHDNNLIKKINIVFEYIDNEIIKDIIEEISEDIKIEILAQGYYFKESIEPIYHQNIKNYIEKFIKNI